MTTTKSGARVGFRFHLEMVGNVGGELREGVGVIVQEDYCGTTAAFWIKVETSPHYKAGEFVLCKAYNTTKAGVAK